MEPKNKENVIKMDACLLIAGQTLCFFTIGHEYINPYRACLDGVKQTNTFHPNTCVSLVLVVTNTPEKLTPPRGGNWC
jgi:hypothetical protein